MFRPATQLGVAKIWPSPSQPPCFLLHQPPTFINLSLSRKPSDWNFLTFAAGLASQHPTITYGEANSRFLNTLKKIVVSTNFSSSAHDKAQSLIDASRARGKKRRHEPDTLVIHGGVNVGSGGQIINARGDVSVTRQDSESVKRRRREPSPESRQHEHGDEEGISDDGENSAGERTEESDDGGDDSDFSTPATPPPYNHQLHAFLAAFATMKSKRRFTTGGTLQDIIHNRVTEDPSSAGEFIHWIIDPSSNKFAGTDPWLTSQELKELQGWVPSTPKVDECFTYARKRYDNKLTVSELRKTAESPPRPPGVQYDRKRNFDATYVNNAAGVILSMIEQGNSNGSFGPQGHKEGWYGSKVWSIILDHCMDDLDNFTVSRTEIQSKSGCSNKRFDAIFLGRAGVEIAEFGAIEVARSADVLAPGKRVCDEEKLRDVMAAMLKSLLEHVDYDMEASKHIQVVGVQNLGFNIRISTMCCVSDGVFLLKRGTWREVPSKLEKFHSVFGVMQSVVVMKKTIQRTIDTVRRYHDKKTEQVEEFEL